jgi:hypothetical protein
MDEWWSWWTTPAAGLMRDLKLTPICGEVLELTPICGVTPQIGVNFQSLSNCCGSGRFAELRMHPPYK